MTFGKMKAQIIMFFCVIASLNVGCAKKADGARALAAKAGALTLRTEASKIIPYTKTEEYRKTAPYVPQSQWPELFNQFHPVDIAVYDTSIVIIQRKFVSQWAGIEIVGLGINYEPKGRTERLADGVYYIWK